MKTTKPTSPEPNGANVVPLPISKRDKRRAEDKWSAQVIKLGYTPLPSLLLRAQAKLGITPTQLNVLVQIIEHWWEADKLPYPSKETIARRMGVTSRQIQRVLSQLEKAELIKRQERFLGHRGQTSNAYSLEGLVAKLKSVELEFRKAIDQNRLRRKKVESPAA